MKDFEREDLMKAVRLMMVTSWISLMSVLILRYGLETVCRMISSMK